MIDSKEISVVVQGAINKTETEKCLKSIRKHLPDAEIIVSTWQGSDVSFLDGLYDVVILNEDPGCGYYFKTEKGFKCNNLNRQLVSTQQGLSSVSRKYAMKIRSDIILTSDKFIKYFDSFQKREDEYSLFKQKILVSSCCSRFSMADYTGRNLIKESNIAFHVSDWWFFGLKEDLVNYFDVPQAKEPEFSSYYKDTANSDKFNPYIIFDEYVQFSPEQYFAIMCFKKKFPNIKITHAGDVSEEIIEQSRKYLINNFIFLEYCQSGIYIKKHLISKYHWLSPIYLDLYNKYRQEYEYQKFCDNGYKINRYTKFVVENAAYKKARMMSMIYFYRMIRRKKEKK